MSRVASVLFAAALAASAWPLVSVAGQSNQSDLRVPAEGRTLYVDHCASCHGASGRGDGPAADSMRRTPSNLTLYSQRNGGVFPSERLRRIIDGRGVGAHGSVEMPVWGAVFNASGAGGEAGARARIDAILAHLQSIQERSGE